MSYNLKERVHRTFNQYLSCFLKQTKKIVIILRKYIAKLHVITVVTIFFFLPR